MSPSAIKLLEKGQIRDARRDKEAQISDVIHTSSRFTRDSLVAAGLPLEKIMVVPLGCPEISQHARRKTPPQKVRFLYSGPVSVRKGAHVLIKAWTQLKPHNAAELHFFGIDTLPQGFTDNPPPGVFFHGPVTSKRMVQEYLCSSVLVFPTLCDGFGMVVPEAFCHGLPVITTPNAGAADLVKENENGWIVPPADAEALAERMQFCLSHPHVLASMCEPARMTARNWTWGHFRASFLSQLNTHLNRVASNTGKAGAEFERART
jgi:glycosyltransferase involved in cell wall biosynthesis